MTEQEAERKFDFWQSIHYEMDVVEVHFDIHWDETTPHMNEGAQVFYRGANITNLVDWEKIDKAINWKRVEEEARDNW